MRKKQFFGKSDFADATTSIPVVAVTLGAVASFALELVRAVAFGPSLVVVTLVAVALVSHVTTLLAAGVSSLTTFESTGLGPLALVALLGRPGRTGSDLLRVGLVGLGAPELRLPGPGLLRPRLPGLGLLRPRLPGLGLPRLRLSGLAGHPARLFESLGVRPLSGRSLVRLLRRRPLAGLVGLLAGLVLAALLSGLLLAGLAAGLLSRLPPGLLSRLARGLVRLLGRRPSLWRFGGVVLPGLPSTGLGVLPASLAGLPTLLARLALLLRELLAAVGSLGVARLVSRLTAESEAVAASLRGLRVAGLLALGGLAALRRLTALSLALRRLAALLLSPLRLLALR
ncbi:hypothetical protein [Halorussus ruber]|uniref:hypothetical protein n=1 Tax=Halorussus ruber TaxID=1126238 RepID=UPI001091F9F6|nr:hypothetical protein [Halorussus ruber]